MLIHPKNQFFAFFVLILLLACILYSKFHSMISFTTQVSSSGPKSIILQNIDEATIYRWKKSKFKEKIPKKFSDFYKNELNVTKRYLAIKGKCRLTVHDVGRLGNQMFEYLGLHILSKRYPDIVACISEKKALVLKLFTGLELPVVGPLIYSKLWMKGAEIREKRVKDIHENKTVLGFGKNRSYYLAGVPKPIWYAVQHEEEIRKMFKIHPKVEDEARKYLASLSPSGRETLIGLHIRRTDYSRWLRKNSNAELFDSNWVFNAMKTAVGAVKRGLNETIFVVASDDFNWCKRHLTHDPGYKIAFTQDYYREIGKAVNRVYFDFAVLANCHHNIFQYGTFGFWSAFLSGGETFLSRQYDEGSENVELVREIIDAKLNVTRFHFI